MDTMTDARQAARHDAALGAAAGREFLTFCLGDEEYGIPDSLLKSRAEISDAPLPFTLRVHAYHDNAALAMRAPSDAPVLGHRRNRRRNVLPAPAAGDRR